MQKVKSHYFCLSKLLILRRAIFLINNIERKEIFLLIISARFLGLDKFLK
jgi:hypothetical protein